MNSSKDFLEIKQFLDNRVSQYNSNDFINSDPIQIPHLFSGKEDIEISAFLTATIAWGQRKSIINNASKLMEWMDNSPYEFLIDADNSDWKRISNFVHRTFNGNDCLFFLESLKNIYQYQGGLENVFTKGYQIEN